MCMSLPKSLSIQAISKSIGAGKRASYCPVRKTMVRRMNTVATPSLRAKTPINLLRGWPNAGLLPNTLLRQAAEKALLNPTVYVPGLEYGPDEGDQRLRQAVADWTSEFYGTESDVNRIAITGGASQNLACVLQTFTDPAYTRNVWIIAPAYMNVFRIFDDSGLKLKAVPEDSQGLDIDFLRKALLEADQRADKSQPFKQARSWAKLYRHVIYAVPSFSNPSSKTMSLQRRKELVQVARDHDALIITDDVYDQLQWRVNPPPSGHDDALTKACEPRLVDIDRAMEPRPDKSSFGNVASSGSFSKICAPGTRTGWCEGTPKLAYGVGQTGSTRSGGAPSSLAATFIAELLISGQLQDHIYNTLQPTYAVRWRRMMASIREHLVPLGASLPQEDRAIVGGYFIWVHLPKTIPAALLAQRARDEENLIIAPGAMFEVPGDSDVASFTHDIRLCFAWEEESNVDEGILRLAGVLGRMVREAEMGGGSQVASGGSWSAEEFR